VSETSFGVILILKSHNLDTGALNVISFDIVKFLKVCVEVGMLGIYGPEVNDLIETH